MSTTARKPRLNREQQKALRAQELLDAAWELFCQKGYETLSIDEVAEYAGYSRMPIYSLFGDKQNLFFELWRNKTGQLEQLLLANCRAGETLSHNLHALAEIIAVSSQTPNPQHGEYLFFVVQTISINRPDIKDRVDSLARELVADFAEMITSSTLEKGQSLRDSPERVAEHILAQINGIATLQFQTRQSFLTTASLGDIFCRLALK